MVEPQDTHRWRIVLADDHAVVRAGIRNALADLPDVQIVGEAGDGQAVFAALAHLRPDGLLIDVAMPQFDPIRSIRQIRAQYPTLRILVVSAHDDDVYVQGLFGVGVDGYHLKDQPLNDLRLAVQRVLGGGRWISDRLVEKLARPQTQPASSLPLTQRQHELLQLLQQGYDNQAIARQMDLSVKTVENHLTRLYRQLNVQSRLEAVSYAQQHSLGVRRDGTVGVTSLPRSPVEATGDEQITLLVVDDNPRYGRQLQRTVGLVCPQATIHMAETIREAVAICRTSTPQLALVDVVLGDENGIQCVRQLKAVSPHTRIILMTAYPDREFHRLGLEAGAVALLDKKDLDAAALRQLVTDVVV